MLAEGVAGPWALGRAQVAAERLCVCLCVRLCEGLTATFTHTLTPAATTSVIHQAASQVAGPKSIHRAARQQQVAKHEASGQAVARRLESGQCQRNYSALNLAGATLAGTQVQQLFTGSQAYANAWRGLSLFRGARHAETAGWLRGVGTRPPRQT